MKPEIAGQGPDRWGPRDPSGGGRLSRGNRPPGAVGDVDHYPSTRLPDSWPPPPPRRLFAGRYEIVEELGRGGMGIVSRARDTRLPRDVAIKVPSRLRDPGSLRRFLKEAEAAAKLDHPNIGRILDLGEADGLPFIVLAFVDGPTLAEALGRRPIDPIRAAKVARSVARTIQFAHDRGIIHRDLKPANLMIGPHRELIVMDFGLARLEGDERETRTGQVFGTLPYMSPEQVQGRARDMGKGCDIYALGVILYELLTGRLPFRGPAWELPRQIVRSEPAPPSSIRPEVAPALDAIVLKAMAKAIPDRFGSMAEFAGAIAAHLRRAGSPSDSGIDHRPRAVPVRPAATEVTFSVRVRPEPLQEPHRPRLEAWDVLVWGSIATLALAGVAASIEARRPTPPPSAGAEPGPAPSDHHPFEGGQTFG